MFKRLWRIWEVLDSALALWGRIPRLVKKAASRGWGLIVGFVAANASGWLSVIWIDGVMRPLIIGVVVGIIVSVILTKVAYKIAENLKSNAAIPTTAPTPQPDNKAMPKRKPTFGLEVTSYSRPSRGPVSTKSEIGPHKLEVKIIQAGFDVMTEVRGITVFWVPGMDFRTFKVLVGLYPDYPMDLERGWMRLNKPDLPTPMQYDARTLGLSELKMGDS